MHAQMLDAVLRGGGAPRAGGSSGRSTPAPSGAKKGTKKRAASPSPTPSGARGRPAPAARRGPLSRLGSTPASAPPAMRQRGRGSALPGLDPFIGRKLWRHWPNEARQWAEGVITDFNPTDGAHCVVYDLNTAREAFEWFVLAAGVEGVDWRWSSSPPVDLASLAPPAGTPLLGTPVAPLPPTRLAMTAPRIVGGGRARERDRRRARAAPPPPRPVAEFNFERAVVPFDASYFVSKMAGASMDALEAMAAVLDARAAELRSEAASLDALLAGGLTAEAELAHKLEVIISRQRAVKAALADLALAPATPGPEAAAAVEGAEGGAPAAAAPVPPAPTGDAPAAAAPAGEAVAAVAAEPAHAPVSEPPAAAVPPA
jgi:hypothetical protein